MPRPSFSFAALGTSWEIVTDVPLSPRACETITKNLESFEAELSRFRSDSQVATMATQAGEYAFPENYADLFLFYKNLYSATAGKFTPLAGESLEQLGYDANCSFETGAPVSAKKMNQAIEMTGSTITVREPTLLDFGAAGKGFAVDMVAQYLADQEILSYVVDASGDIRVDGDVAETIGLEDPRCPGKVIGSVSIKNESLCGSAVNRRTWGDGLHHVIDPDTGLPTHEIIATWVIARSTMEADGLATALFFTEPQKLAAAYTFDYMRVYASGKIEYSKRFEGALFS